MKKISIISLLIFSLMFSFVFADTVSLKDLDNHWGKDHIVKLVNAGNINGYKDGTFKPDNPITVAEFIKILMSSLGYRSLGNSTVDHWAKNYIEKAEELGIIQREDWFTNYSSYDLNITRGQMARMVIRAIKEEYPDNMNDYINQIRDYQHIDRDFKEYALKAYAKGIISGYEDNTFREYKTATRAEASAIIIRTFLKSERKTPALQPTAVHQDFIEPIIDINYLEKPQELCFYNIEILNYEDYTKSKDDYSVKIECVNYPQLNISEVPTMWQKEPVKVIRNQWKNNYGKSYTSPRLLTLPRKCYTTLKEEEDFKLRLGMKIDYIVTVKNNSTKIAKRYPIIAEIKKEYFIHYDDNNQPYTIWTEK
jgi:hypothetical protein